MSERSTVLLEHHLKGNYPTFPISTLQGLP